MINEERIKEMISKYAQVHNSWLDNPPSEENDYSKWPKSFSGEEYNIANQIYHISMKMKTLRITEFQKQEILEKILSNSPLRKA